jgi:hypothetical protein
MLRLTQRLLLAQGRPPPRGLPSHVSFRVPNKRKPRKELINSAASSDQLAAFNDISLRELRELRDSTEFQVFMRNIAKPYQALSNALKAEGLPVHAAAPDVKRMLDAVRYMLAKASHPRSPGELARFASWASLDGVLSLAMLELVCRRAALVMRKAGPDDIRRFLQAMDMQPECASLSWGRDMRDKLGARLLFVLPQFRQRSELSKVIRSLAALDFTDPVVYNAAAARALALRSGDAALDARDLADLCAALAAANMRSHRRVVSSFSRRQHSIEPSMLEEGLVAAVLAALPHCDATSISVLASAVGTLGLMGGSAPPGVPPLMADGVATSVHYDMLWQALEERCIRLLPAMIPPEPQRILNAFARATRAVSLEAAKQVNAPCGNVRLCVGGL